MEGPCRGKIPKADKADSCPTKTHSPSRKKKLVILSNTPIIATSPSVLAVTEAHASRPLASVTTLLGDPAAIDAVVAL